MRKLLLYLLLFCTGIASAQIVNIPDANFRNKLLAANTTNNIAKNSGGASIKVDVNNDTYIQQSEVDAVYELDVSSSSILNMTGIQNFNNLQVLNCQDNAISTLTLTGLTDLETIYCGQNNLITLAITGLSNLRGLYCSGNNLSSISFTGVTDLRWLECNDNQFSTLNVTALANLRELKCNSNSMIGLSVANLGDLRLIECAVNSLSTLNLSGLDHLESLVCYQNYLTALDFTGLEYLISVNCAKNQITTLDFSGNPAFNELECFQNDGLTYINIKNGNNQIYDAATAPNNWYDNPDLAFICIDESEASVINTIIAENGIIVNFNTYCTFVPGGDYNTITGALLFDGDNDGCDTGDTPQPFIKIGIDDGTTTGATFSDGEGDYAFYTGAGTFTIAPQLENDSYFTIMPSSDSITFPVVDNSVVTDNFCITANGVHPDVEVVIEPLMAAVPGGQATYKLVYKNKGNQVLSGSVTLSCDEDYLDYAAVDPAPDDIVTGTYTWNYTNLKPFENREINVALDINSPTDFPAVNVGDVLLFSSTITAAGDDNPQDNSFDFDQVAVGASNPNNITCIEGDSESADAIGDYLHYAVNFKNTGTEPTASIVIAHDFDPSQFDITTLQVLNSSHRTRARVTGNKIEFIMQNVSLAAAGHGNILFKVKTKPSVLQGQTVTNQARIFFDYKAPVETNDANTTFETLGTGDFEKDNSVKVYPNPARHILNITSDNIVKSIELYDVQGRLLETGIVNDISTTIDMTMRPTGIYFVKVTTDKGVKVENVIRE